MRKRIKIRITSFLLAAVMVLGLCACGDKEGQDSSTQELKSGGAVMLVPGDWETMEQTADNLSCMLAKSPVAQPQAAEDESGTADVPSDASSQAAFSESANQVIGLYSCQAEEEIIDLAAFKDDPSALNELLYALTDESLYRNRPVSVDYLEGEPPMVVASFVEYSTATAGTTYLVYFTAQGDRCYAVVTFAPGRSLYTEEVNLAAAAVATLQLPGGEGGGQEGE